MKRFSMAVLILVGCASSGQPKVGSCEARGGTVVGTTCQRPTDDAGKTCTNNRDCDGYCAPPDSIYVERPGGGRALRIDNNKAVVGVCSAIQTWPRVPLCTAFVSDGKVTGTICP